MIAEETAGRRDVRKKRQLKESMSDKVEENMEKEDDSARSRRKT